MQNVLTFLFKCGLVRIYEIHPVFLKVDPDPGLIPMQLTLADGRRRIALRFRQILEQNNLSIGFLFGKHFFTSSIKLSLEM